MIESRVCGSRFAVEGISWRSVPSKAKILPSGSPGLGSYFEGLAILFSAPVGEDIVSLPLLPSCPSQVTWGMGDIRLTTELVKHLVPIGLALRGMRLAKAKVTRGADITALIWVNLSLWMMIKSGRRWELGIPSCLG